MSATPEGDHGAVVVQLQIRMPKTTHEKLRRRAYKESRPLSSVARRLIEEGLKRKPEPAL